MRLKITLIDGEHFEANVTAYKAVENFTLFFLKTPGFHGKFILTANIREITEISARQPQEPFIPVAF